MKLGFIGQGFVGKNLADDFERRGHSVIRYALEPEYALNRRMIPDCDVVFIAVPTPTTKDGFDAGIVKEAVALVGEGKIAVIKSTVLPGTTREIQDQHPNTVVLFSPEFLCEATAAYDVAHPMFNIVGVPHDSAGHRKAAETVIKMYPQSDHNFVVRAQAAELFKYAHNVHGFMRVILSNLLYDMADSINVDWADVKLIMDTDPMMSPYYNAPVHKGGRGAGGNCFVKDMAAFARLYRTLRPEDYGGISVLESLEQKNLELLRASHKSQVIVRDVYGHSEENSESVPQEDTGQYHRSDID
jgi:UDPglucose 6-dehydrogenase